MKPFFAVDLEWAEGHYDSACGLIRVSWKQNKFDHNSGPLKRAILSVTVPPGFAEAKIALMSRANSPLQLCATGNLEAASTASYLDCLSFTEITPSASLNEWANHPLQQTLLNSSGVTAIFRDHSELILAHVQTGHFQFAVEIT